MRRLCAAIVIGIVTAIAAGPATAASDENASCMGLGASFYGQFAPQQMAFVAEFVNTSAKDVGAPPGATYSFFAGEKEGGAIPSPCGTRLE